MNLGKAKLKAIVTFCDQSGHLFWCNCQPKTHVNYPLCFYHAHQGSWLLVEKWEVIFPQIKKSNRGDIFLDVEICRR